LLARGILSKDTHGTVVRIAPPLNVAQADLEWAVRELRDVLHELEQESR
jgi:ornithine--oxo-acid transaminase